MGYSATEIMERLETVVNDAVTRMEMGKGVSIEIKIGNDGIEISDWMAAPPRPRVGEYDFDPGETGAGGIAAKIDQDATTLADERERILKMADVLMTGGKVEAIQGEALLNSNIFADIACAAASHGMTANFSVYYSPVDAKEVARDPNQP